MALALYPDNQLRLDLILELGYSVSAYHQAHSIIEIYLFSLKDKNLPSIKLNDINAHSSWSGASVENTLFDMSIKRILVEERIPYYGFIDVEKVRALVSPPKYSKSS